MKRQTQLLRIVTATDYRLEYQVFVRREREKYVKWQKYEENEMCHETAMVTEEPLKRDTIFSI